MSIRPHFHQPHAHHHVVTTPSVSAEIAQPNINITSMSQSHSQARQSPKPQPRSSTSPSKSSLRGVSATKEQVQTQSRGLGLLPSPSFDQPPVRTASPKTVGFDESTVAAESVEQPLFQPFFTLINDNVTAEHFHPTVHYVFTDDEEGDEMISEGVLRSLQRLEGMGKQPVDKEERREHVLILDVDVKRAAREAGYEVVQAQSLSADWQVNNVEVTSAPTMSEEDADGGLMLRIEGGGPVEDTRGHEMGRENLEEMLGRYTKGLEEIRRMVGVGVGEERGGEGDS